MLELLHLKKFCLKLHKHVRENNMHNTAMLSIYYKFWIEMLDMNIMQNIMKEKNYFQNLYA
jgi:hypothetical protein